jgi:GNAT superfamily N-acetyltransferase
LSGCVDTLAFMPSITVTDQIDPDLEAVIGAGLDEFNEQQAGYRDRRSLAVVVRDPVTGEAVGGATGRTSLGMLFLDLFYLPEHLRGSGIGSQILRAFEDEGRRRGCRSAVLYTISFQAPGFYARHGWRAFGEIPCDSGTSRIYMTKEL